MSAEQPYHQPEIEGHQPGPAVELVQTEATGTDHVTPAVAAAIEKFRERGLEIDEARIERALIRRSSIEARRGVQTRRERRVALLGRLGLVVTPTRYDPPSKPVHYDD
ncbi:hypothetical protein H7Y63_00125 [Polaromonas sp.]|nr:hypothetical protein [Candidatus Saccharibacteria bacterium]